MKSIKFNTSIFTYPMFLSAVAAPITAATLLMLLIACSSNLSFTSITKESLELFVAYQKIPLFILSLALPLGTVTAANFRAIQFQKNLNRQEYEHHLDLYYKNIHEFEKKLQGSLEGSDTTFITIKHAYLIYSRFHSKPNYGELVDVKPNAKRIENISKKIIEIHGLFNSIDENHEILAKFIKNEFGKDIDKIIEKNMYALKALCFICEVNPLITSVASMFGVKFPKPDDTLRDHILAIISITRALTSFFSPVPENENLQSIIKTLDIKSRAWIEYSLLNSSDIRPSAIRAMYSNLKN